MQILGCSGQTAQDLLGDSGGQHRQDSQHAAVARFTQQGWT